MASPYTADTPKLKLKIDGAVGLANRAPPNTDAEFDSEIIGYEDGSSNADLKITLKVWFNKKEPPATPSHGQLTPVKAWGTDPQVIVKPGFNDGDFAKFKSLVLQEANSFWNAKMWLVTPTTYDGLDWLPIPYATRIRPNIHCLFNAVEASSPSQAHLSIDCWRLVSGNSCVSFASYSNEYDNWDLVEYGYSVSVDVGIGADKIASGSVLPKQMTIWHEMGHAIGQEHTAVHVAGCSGGNNAGYGNCVAADPSMTKNIMGLGKEITAYNGKPWAKRMAKHTNGTTVETDWITWTSRPIPKSVP